MIPLALMFTLAPPIVEGLLTGKYKRFGGVIREAATGQIVTMLRERGTSGVLPGSPLNSSIGAASLIAAAGNIATSVDTSSNVTQRFNGIEQQLSNLNQNTGLPLLFDPITGVLNLILSGVNTGVSVTGFSNVNQRLDEIGEQLGIISKNLQEAEGILQLTSASSVLNLGVSVMGFSVIAHRLGELEQRLQKAQEVLNKINRKIDLGFYANFRAALDLANNAFTMTKSENRRSSALAAINRFLEAEHIYTDYVDQELAQESQIVDEYLLTLSLAYIAEARCYLELEEFDTALRRFQEGSEKIRSRITKYVELLLTSNPAAYLDPQFKEKIDLRRLTRIYQWLDPSLDENAVFEQQRENLFNWKKEQGSESRYKWVNSLPSAIVASAEVQGSAFGVLGNREEVKQEAMKRLPQAMEMMESLIETNYRFETYQTEVKMISQLGISFHDWLRLAPQAPQPEGANLMYIVPSKPLSL